MSCETEKLTINLGVVELAQIDVLVEQGIFSNRSDFIRSAIRRDLEEHHENMERQLTPISSKKNWVKSIGIWIVNKDALEELAEESGEKLNISVIGMLVFDQSITLELFEKTVRKVILRGKLVASDEVKEAIHRMNA